MKLNTIYKLDCIEFLNSIEDNFIDLAILDPPYNMKKADWDSFISEKSFLNFTFNWIECSLGFRRYMCYG